MSKRDEIGTGRLVYSCNCGWLDLGHAGIDLSDPTGPKRKAGKNPHPDVGADKLWKKITDQKGTASLLDKSGFKVSYRQEMSKSILTAGESRDYWVKYNLSVGEKEQVALAIFMEVSIAFEGMQDSFPYSRFTDSGFSMEDLVSNLIGFYVVVRPALLNRLSSLCDIVSKKATYDVWDSYGAVGQTKNKNFTPIYRRCSECDSKPAPTFPKEFQAITPAKKGDWDPKANKTNGLFRDWLPMDAGSPWSGSDLRGM